jgi:hypothetical protein
MRRVEKMRRAPRLFSKRGKSGVGRLKSEIRRGLVCYTPPAMGTFTRSGTFRDRDRFIGAVRSKLAVLRDGPLRGVSESWEDGPPTRAILAGFGARFTFTIGESDWNVDASLPPFVPLSYIESKFDREFSDLQGI